MRDLAALRLALYLFHLPSAVRGARDKALPGGIGSLLEVAAGETEAAEEAAARLERPVDVVCQACAFFIEQIMLAPDTDAYRVLGAARDAADSELRHHMALLLRWVHPDTKRAGDRIIYASRVTRAWEALKTHDRRAAYDAANPPRSAKPRAGEGRRPHDAHSHVGLRAMKHGAGAAPPTAGQTPAAPSSAGAPKPGLIGRVLGLMRRRRAAT